MDDNDATSARISLGYEMQRPSEFVRRLDAASVAYVPVGPLEHHGAHLPYGVDLMTADELCRRTAGRTGGVVLPPLYVASGVLPLPGSIDFSLDTLRAVVREVLAGLAANGIRVIVVFSGHGALDHLHVLRTECDRLMEQNPDVRALATIWNELTVDVDGDIHDHAAKVETSYMMELWPDTVVAADLADDPAAEHVGVYGPNPRFTASREWGNELSTHVVAGLTDRVLAMLQGEPADSWVDFRALVARMQSGDLSVIADSGTASEEGVEISLHNPHGQSKYITGVLSARWDGHDIDPAKLTFLNSSVGEHRVRRSASGLGPLSGFYLRRQQSCALAVADLDATPGAHELFLRLELAGVMDIEATGPVDIATGTR